MQKHQAFALVVQTLDPVVQHRVLTLECIRVTQKLFKNTLFYIQQLWDVT